MNNFITIDEVSTQSSNQKTNVHTGVARLNVIAEDYTINPITEESYAKDIHVTGFISLLIDVYGLEDTVAYTAPDLIQQLSKEKLENKNLIKFITNLKPTTEKLFITVSSRLHWTLFYFDKSSKILEYYDPYNRNNPDNDLCEIVKLIIVAAFGNITYELKIIKLPLLLIQTDKFNCGFWIMAYIEIILLKKLMKAIVKFSIKEMRNKVKKIFEKIKESRQIPYEIFETDETATSDGLKPFFSICNRNT